MPVDTSNRAADGFLEVFRHPPVVFLLEVTDCDDTGAAADGEFLLGGGPPDECCGAVYPEEDESGDPAGRGGGPDVSVSI
jgi:hypothetical protein